MRWTKFEKFAVLAVLLLIAVAALTTMIKGTNHDEVVDISFSLDCRELEGQPKKLLPIHIEDYEEENHRREKFKQSCNAISTGKQDPSKYRTARWGLFEQNGRWVGGRSRLLNSF